MPSKLPIYSARLGPDIIERLEAVRERAKLAHGLPVSQAGLLLLALPLLEAAYPPRPPRKENRKNRKPPLDRC